MMKNNTALLLILILLTAALAACGGTAAEPAASGADAVDAVAETPPTEVPPTEVPPTEVPPTEAPPTDTPEPELTAEERGREIFLNGGAYEGFKPENACAHCHSLDGRVSADSIIGPSLLGVGTRAGERAPGLSDAEYIKQSIKEPSAFVAMTYKNKMSNFAAKFLTEEEVDDVVAFLLTLTEGVDPGIDTPLASPPLPEGEIDLAMSIAEEGNPTRGRISASSFRCLDCHANEEIAGFAPPFASYDDLPPIMERGELRIADPAYEGQAVSNQEYVLESIFLPETYLAPGEWNDVMPYNYHQYLTDADLANIMAWLAEFE